MENKKTFVIVINGVQESIDAVKALNDQLSVLETKINALQNKVVNVTSNVTTNTTSSSNKTSELKEEDALLRQIQSTEEKIAQVRSDEYQELLHQKDILKEVKKEGESRFAEDNLVLKEYSNTMLGVKERLADLKKAMQTKDMDSDEFKKMAQEANELNTKLKEAEQSYGQFGRNVGNYTNGVADGIKKFSVEIGGISEEFDSARQALKALKTEMQTLSTKKDMGIISEEESERLKSLIPTVKELESSIADAGKPMDALMDTFQSLVAVMQTTKGISAFFGIDSDEIDKTIKNLVALQNAMQGLQTIQKQIQTGEGIGGLFAKGNAAIDAFINKLFGLNTAAKTTNATLATTSTEAKGAAASIGTAGAAADTAAKSFTAASVGAKLLSGALKTIGIGLAIAAIAKLVEGISALIEKQKEAKKHQEELQKAVEEGQKAYAKTSAEIAIYQARIDRFAGTKKQEKKLVDELNSKYGTSLGQYKSLFEWKKILAERGEVLCRVMMKEAEMTALLTQYQDAYLNLQNVKKDKKGDWLYENFGFLGKSYKERFNEAKANFDEITKLILEKQGEISELTEQFNLFNAPSVEKGTKKTTDAMKKAQAEIIRLQLELMDDSLTKTLLQLKTERDKRIDEAKKTGELVAEQTELINQLYDKKEIEARKAHYKQLLDIQRGYAEDFLKLQEETYAQALENSKLSAKIDMEDVIDTDYRSTFTSFYKDMLIDLNKFQFKVIPPEKRDAADWKAYFDTIQAELKGFEKVYEDFKIEVGEDGIINYIFPDNWTAEKDEMVALREYVDNLINEMNYAQEELKKYSNDITIELMDDDERLNASFEQRLQARYKAREIYYNQELEAATKYYNKLSSLQDDEIEDEERKRKDAENKRHSKVAGNLPIDVTESKKTLDEWLKQQDEALKKGEITIKEYTENTKGTLLESYRKNELTFEQFTENLEQENETHQNRMNTIEKNAQLESENNNNEHLKNLRSTTIGYFDNIGRELGQEISSISRMRDKAQKANVLGIINIDETKKNLNSLLNALKDKVKDIQRQKDALNKAFQGGSIDMSGYDQAMQRLNAFESEAMDTIDSIEDEYKQLQSLKIAQIISYVQQTLSYVNSFLSAISDIQSNRFDKDIDDQEKYIDKLQKMYDKQRDITQSYADAVNGIEDELSTARGDRRQQLIDNLNAEMAAQRASLAQEKKIEKEQEKAERKKAELEYEQAVQKKKMDEVQALINAAMAISMAAVNKWPVPAIPMMAMATAVGAAQYLAVKSKHIPKPSYGEGGVIQGKSHREGGVNATVGGNLIELEGNEFIIRKKSTMPNIGLLDFVNRSEKKLSLDDLIEFYTSGNGMRKKVIANSPKTRYADGGQIPTLRNDINLSDRLLTAFEDYSNRPQVVSVVEIVDKMQTVREVQAMAGLVE